MCTLPFSCDEGTGSSEEGGSKAEIFASDEGGGTGGSQPLGDAGATTPEEQPAPVKEEQLTTVGRWMHPDEYQKMLDTGRVQVGRDGQTYAAFTPEGYMKTAQKGFVYVEFDVPASSFRLTNPELGWVRFLSPNSIEGKRAAIQGLPIPELPEALNIELLAVRI